jgi:hypothetical protein
VIPLKFSLSLFRATVNFSSLSFIFRSFNDMPWCLFISKMFGVIFRAHL